MSEEKSYQGISRRSFLKTAAVTAGVSAVGGTALTALADEKLTGVAAEDEVFASYCRGNCGSCGCNLSVHVREGKVVNVTPRRYPDADPETMGRGRACLRGLSNLQRLYDPERVDYPMRRKDGTERGAGEWERVSWEDAINEVATKWNGYIKEYGGSAIARYCIYGSNSLTSGSLGIPWGRLANVIGMSTISNGADMAQIYGQLAWSNTWGIGSDGPAVAANTRNIIVWGQNPCVSLPHEWRYMVEAQENGAKIICIDPRCSTTANKADVHIRPRIGSDAAIAMAAGKYLVDNDLIDKEFLVKHSVAANLVGPNGEILRKSAYGFEPTVLSTNSYSGQNYTDDSAYVWDEALEAAVPFTEATKPALSANGKPFVVDGVEYVTAFDKLCERLEGWTLARGAEIAGITEEEILVVVDALLDGPAAVSVGNGAGHYTNSHLIFTASYMLAILTGNFYKKGAGWGNCGMYGEVSWVPGMLYGYPAGMIVGPTYPSVDLPDVMANKTYCGKPAIIKSILVHSGNPLGNAPNRKAMLKAFSEVEFVVVADMCMSDTAHYADLILPIGHWFEVEEMTGFQYTPYAVLGEKAVEPMFERKSDIATIIEIGRAMGYKDKFVQSEEEVLKEVGDTNGWPDVDGNPITYERLKKEKNIRSLPDHIMSTTVATQDNLLMFYWEKPLPRVYSKPIDFELERMPYFAPPSEVWTEDVAEFKKNPLADKYPLIYMNIHQRFTTHTTYGHVPWLQELSGEPHIKISPVDAEARGIKDGDKVRVFNDRGYVVVLARLDAGLMPGSVNLPHGWEACHFIEGHYQDLTSGAYDPFDGNESYWDTLVEVELWKGGDK